MKYILAIVILIGLTTIGYCHDHGASIEINEWLKTLTNQHGLSCCAGDDAKHIIDWQWAKDHFEVWINNDWVRVPDEAVVKQPSQDGIARAWIQYFNGIPAIRCFLPGSMG